MKFSTPKARARLAEVISILTADYHIYAPEVARRTGLCDAQARVYVNEARARIAIAKRKNPQAPPERRKAPRPATYTVPVFLAL